MKRILAMLLTVVLVLTLTACGGDAGKDSTNTTTQAAGENSGDGATSIKMNVTIKEGTTPVEKGLDFGGKTFRYAAGIALSESRQRMMTKFEKQYNCKLESDLFGFQTYVQDLAARNAAGTKYEIIEVEGVRFPSIAITNLVVPLEDVISTADWAKGGFDKELTNNFAWNNHLYAVVPQAGPFSPQMMVLFYNKKIIKEAGLDDPRELYEKGKWDWDAFYELGTDLVKNGVFLADRYTAGYVANWNDADIIDTSDPANPKANLSSTAYINAFKYLQKLTLGENKVINPNLPGADETPKVFLEGKTAMWCGFYFDLYENYTLGDGVAASNYFGKNVENLGIVPGPFGPENKDKAHTVGSFVYGIGAGMGCSDPLVSMAFAKFSAAHKNNTKEKYSYSDEDLALIEAMANGPKNYMASTYSDASNTTTGIKGQIFYRVAFGEDIAKLVAEYNQMLQNCIDVTIKQQ